MANQFDRWQKDAFFSAAEEVQESADSMESAYRIWERERKEGFAVDDSDELRKELHTALGTTKWQLEEFERAVKGCHQGRSAENMIARHKQFVAAIESQVSRIEKALRDSIAEEGKQPFRWVQLDKQEKDDLAAFLSGSPQNLRGVRHESIASTRSSTKEALKENQYPILVAKEHTKSIFDAQGIPLCQNGLKEGAGTATSQDANVPKLANKEILRTADGVHSPDEKVDKPLKTWNSSDVGDWKIIIADEDAENNALDARPQPQGTLQLCGLLRNIEARTGIHLFRSSFRKWKVDCQQDKIGISSYLDLQVSQRLRQGMSVLKERSRSCLNRCREDVKTSNSKQFLGRVEGYRRQLKSVQYYVQSNPSLKFTLMVLLSILFVVCFRLGD
ncbi:uncharacterized protein LOC116250903 isoform X2 [Nymphaea colorata]|uniref:uncharacterized protein LOC116250903 isoform X2 n=1 Tax=Nymphaea colorata TaxID=210225 RepID=UPI00129E9D3F|nr:uncharacterized protein LOC116250903 isoform X2 [Nymphaea colorata]